jgi:hypothetical protein
MALPLVYEGPATLGFRFGPPPGGPSRIDVTVGDQPLGSVECCRHRALQRRTLDATAARPTVVEVGLRVTGEGNGRHGLWLDVLDLELGAGARFALTGRASLRPSALVLGAILALALGGFAPGTAALLAAPLAAVLGAGLVLDPWLVHRLLTWVPELVWLAGVPGAGLGRLVARRGGLRPAVLRPAVALGLLAFLVRAAFVNDPRFYYPDLRVHAGLVEVVRQAGFDVLRAPYAVLYTPSGTPRGTDTLVRTTSGLWLRSFGGASLGLPYSLALHALLAPLSLGQDALVTALKLTGALFSALAVPLLALLAHRLGTSPWAAAFVLSAPVPAAELALGAVPATFGHAVDLAFLLLLTASIDAADEAKTWARTALAAAAAQLAYVSSIATSLGVGLLTALVLLRAREGGRRRAMGLATAVVCGSLAALLVYYRDFVPAAWAALRLVVGGAQLLEAGAAGHDPGTGRVAAAFAAWMVPLTGGLAAAGLVVLARRAAARPVVLGWAGAVALLFALQWLKPALLGFLHLPLLASALVALLVGTTLEALAARGRSSAVLAALSGLLVAGQGFWLQAQLVAARSQP